MLSSTGPTINNLYQLLVSKAQAPKASARQVSSTNKKFALKDYNKHRGGRRDRNMIFKSSKCSSRK
ncbi:hypothetical protein AG1IA_08903 [Rhizoctonia solani AG-1 IA]|uniref:Uncharacterized protein n=1 Tax=Thanatephorus cucumeris (strain AG1-IA) TaxID=983506 RepID=L8WK13_THACA|nr:hypothetical protein AG1IA_08903 [Rhizoctonia solani AG-1 IA]